MLGETYVDTELHLHRSIGVKRYFLIGPM